MHSLPYWRIAPTLNILPSYSWIAVRNIRVVLNRAELTVN